MDFFLLGYLGTFHSKRLHELARARILCHIFPFFQRLASNCWTLCRMIWTGFNMLWLVLNGHKISSCHCWQMMAHLGLSLLCDSDRPLWHCHTCSGSLQVGPITPEAVLSDCIASTAGRGKLWDCSCSNVIHINLNGCPKLNHYCLLCFWPAWLTASSLYWAGISYWLLTYVAYTTAHWHPHCDWHGFPVDTTACQWHNFTLLSKSLSQAAVVFKLQPSAAGASSC
jgi:hypothetical protein